jgi:hypothetical protein
MPENQGVKMIERYNAYLMVTRGKNKGRYEHPVLTGSFRAESYTQALAYAYDKLPTNSQRKRWKGKIIVEKVKEI